MKKLMKAILFGAVMLEAVSMMGAEFRIDLQVDKDICGLTADGGSEGVRIDKASWKKEKADRRLLVVGKCGEKWAEKWVQIIPSEDCDVRVELMSSSMKDYDVAYDNIRIENYTLVKILLQIFSLHNQAEMFSAILRVSHSQVFSSTTKVFLSPNSACLPSFHCPTGLI